MTPTDTPACWHPGLAALRIWTGQTPPPEQADDDTGGEQHTAREIEIVGIALAVTGITFWVLALTGLVLGVWLLTTEMT